MDCIFSVAHDRWLVIPATDTPLCPIDNSSVKIRAAGKLYEPEAKYSRESLLDDDDEDANRYENHGNSSNRNIIRFLETEARDDYLSNNLMAQTTAGRVTFAEDIGPNVNLEIIEQEIVNESSTDSLNSNKEIIQLVMRTSSDDTLDTLDEAHSENDIIPPPSDFATEMIPLRKSKSAPAPFKKAHKGATHCCRRFCHKHAVFFGCC